MRNFLRRIRLMLHLAKNDNTPAMSDDGAALATTVRHASGRGVTQVPDSDARSNYAKSFKKRR